MFTHLEIVAAFGLGPVLLFLIGLLYFDSFRLVSFLLVLGVMGLGAIAAVASYAVAGIAMDAAHIDFSTYSRFVAPVIEEGFKAMVLVWLFSRNRIGFMIDAAIMGFAVGTGFALFENSYYAIVFPASNMAVWLVRGLGTSIMHGGVTAAYAITVQYLRERHSETGLSAYLPGLLISASLHSIFNQFSDWPILQAAGTVLALPLSLLFVFDKSEHAVHDWLIHDYESHEHLLADIESGVFAHSQAGRLIKKLAEMLGPKVVADVFAYLKLHTELVLRAEKLLLAKELGENVSASKADLNDFARLHKLERAIGPTVMLTLWPHLKFSRQELFELHRFERSAAHAAN